MHRVDFEEFEDPDTLIMHDFVERYTSHRARIWPEVEAFFHNLPHTLQDLGSTFAQRLAAGTSSSNEFADAFLAPHVARIVYLPLWLINACQRRGISIPDADPFGDDLFISACMGFCGIRIHDDLIDEDRPDVHVDELLLDNLFTLESIRRLQRIFPSDSPLWEYYTALWRDYTCAVGYEKLRNRNGLAPFDETALRHAGNKAALLKTYPIAVALKAGREDEIDPINEMMDAFNIGVQLGNDLQSLERDIEYRHYTAPIVQAALAAGYEEGVHPSVDGLYGALVMYDGVLQVYEQAQRYIEHAREISTWLGIDDITACLNWYLEMLFKAESPWRHLHEK